MAWWCFWIIIFLLVAWVAVKAFTDGAEGLNWDEFWFWITLILFLLAAGILARGFTTALH
jgi:hypothetical protein